MTENKYNKLETVIVEGTGEIKTYEQIAFEYIKNTYPEEEKKAKNKKEHLQNRKSTDNFNKTLDMNFGSFFFNYYTHLLDKEHIFRFLYLSTFANYDNIIIYGKSRGDRAFASKKDLQEILKLKNQQFYDTINYLISKELIILHEDRIEVSKKIITRGKMKGKKEGVIRMFDEAIREIYEKATTKEHNKLGLFVKMLPYINHRNNVICYNPEEELVGEIKPLTLTELTRELGYSTTQKLKKGLMELKVGGESLIMVATINNKNMIVVNPRLYYRGNNIEELLGIINLFKIADGKK